MDKYDNVKSQTSNKVRDEQKEINEEIAKIMQHGHILIREKAHLIHGLNAQLKKTSEHSNKITEMRELGKREAEFEYKCVLNEKQAQHKSGIKNLKDQYEHLLNEKEYQYSQFF